MTAESYVDEEQDELTGSYTFDQLSDEAKDAARDEMRNWQTDDDWWDHVYEDAVRMGALMGIEIGTRSARTMNNRTVSVPDIHFSGFSSQGDGASWAGTYRCKADAVEAIRRECNDEELIAIASELTALQVTLALTGEESISCSITRDRSSYCHSNVMDIDSDSWADDANMLKLLTLMCRFADWIYEQLEQEYDYLTSDEAIDELMDDYLFDADGVII